ncbi:hypothetical protein FHS19_001040 [Paenibacillus rhizosphaerae]|uniref:Uncharacterized protein n=1 Tax=Paenibacillus rhizosphaerae TaxID=297318 RepID=A0A839THV9_9BACL|nr:hypothetical protein [Paenibacillus rhizosphaerae]MBB3126386.1 hypothetical protein [Paenibacillus rhizosphaerae]
MQEAVQNVVRPAKVRRFSTFRRQLKKYKWLLLMTLPGAGKARGRGAGFEDLPCRPAC